MRMVESIQESPGSALACEDRNSGLEQHYCIGRRVCVFVSKEVNAPLKLITVTMNRTPAPAPKAINKVRCMVAGESTASYSAPLL